MERDKSQMILCSCVRDKRAESWAYVVGVSDGCWLEKCFVWRAECKVVVMVDARAWALSWTELKFKAAGLCRVQQTVPLQVGFRGGQLATAR